MVKEYQGAHAVRDFTREMQILARVGWKVQSQVMDRRKLYLSFFGGGIRPFHVFAIYERVNAS
jgi:hypothetical protein